MSKSVLIVEDDILLSLVQKKMVERIGYTVVGSVATGLEAIKKAKEINPDIILMDISLGGALDGIDTMKEIRKSSSVPVIYLSGSSEPEDRERAKIVRPIGFLQKPIKQYQLENYFQKALVGA